MAIFHLSVEHGGRLSGQSAVAKMEYNLRQGKYAGRTDLVASGAANMPAGVSPEAFWAACDEHTRANGRLFTHVEVSLPRELSRPQQIDLVSALLARIGLVDGDHVPLQWAMHDKADGNPHVHIQLSSRADDGVQRELATWFRRVNTKHPEKGGARSWAERTDEEWIESLRATWAQLQNTALRKARSASRVDHRSYARQGIDRAPTWHVGWQSRRRKKAIEHNREVADANAKADESLRALRALKAQDFLRQEERLSALQSDARNAVRLQREADDLMLLEAASSLRKRPGTASGVPQPRPLLEPDFVAKLGKYRGVVLYIEQPADQLAFVDVGMRIKLQDRSDNVRRATLQLAATRWSAIEVSCASDAQAAWLKQAAALGISHRITFKEDGGGHHRPQSPRRKVAP